MELLDILLIPSSILIVGQGPKCLSKSEAYTVGRQKLETSYIIVEYYQAPKQFIFHSKKCNFLPDACNGCQALQNAPSIEQNLHHNSEYSYSAIF